MSRWDLSSQGFVGPSRAKELGARGSGRPHAVMRSTLLWVGGGAFSLPLSHPHPIPPSKGTVWGLTTQASDRGVRQSRMPLTAPDATPLSASQVLAQLILRKGLWEGKIICKIVPILQMSLWRHSRTKELVQVHLQGVGLGLGPRQRLTCWGHASS